PPPPPAVSIPPTPPAGPLATAPESCGCSNGKRATATASGVPRPTAPTVASALRRRLLRAGLNEGVLEALEDRGPLLRRGGRVVVESLDLAERRQPGRRGHVLPHRPAAELRHGQLLPFLRDREVQEEPGRVRVDAFLTRALPSGITAVPSDGYTMPTGP